MQDVHQAIAEEVVRENRNFSDEKHEGIGATQTNKNRTEPRTKAKLCCLCAGYVELNDKCSLCIVCANHARSRVHTGVTVALLSIRHFTSALPNVASIGIVSVIV